MAAWLNLTPPRDRRSRRVRPPFGAIALLLGVVALLATACAAPPPRPAPINVASLQAVSPGAGSTDISAYRLGPGDKVKVTIFGQDKESGAFEIDGSGNMAYPLLGNVPAQGLTVPELQERLRTELDRSFIVNPRVSVEVQNYRPFYIYGEIQKAGSYPYVTGLTVRRAIAIAGGYTRRARYAPVQVTREEVRGSREYDLELDMPVLPGDTIQVMQRLF
jgi:polysaccharide export outer membrane protein